MNFLKLSRSSTVIYSEVKFSKNECNILMSFWLRSSKHAQRVSILLTLGGLYRMMELNKSRSCSYNPFTFLSYFRSTNCSLIQFYKSSIENYLQLMFKSASVLTFLGWHKPIFQIVFEERKDPWEDDQSNSMLCTTKESCLLQFLDFVPFENRFSQNYFYFLKLPNTVSQKECKDDLFSLFVFLMLPNELLVFFPGCVLNVSLNIFYFLKALLSEFFGVLCTVTLFLSMS